MNKEIILAENIATEVEKLGGRVFYVGGYVRDKFLERENKDVDIEVHGIEEPLLKEILGKFGEVMLFGESFSVYNIKGYDVDIALPRTERKVGNGHKGFEVTANPYLGYEKAARRRDFTMNALMEDVLTGVVYDYFGGVDDLIHKVIRHVDDSSFIEDPLRVFRAAQFAARFGFTVAPETVSLCKDIDCSFLSKERVLEETKKALLKSVYPSQFFRILREMEQTAWFKELYDLIGVPQSAIHHAEGDAYEHTLLVVDKAAEVRDKANYPLELMLSALCHDLGKVNSTVVTAEKITAIGHEINGIQIAASMIIRLTTEYSIFNYVTNMVENHMKPHAKFAGKACVKSTSAMFYESVCPKDLILLAYADSQGSLPNTDSKEEFLFLTERETHFEEIIKLPFVTGKDLIKAGLTPSAKFTVLLKLATKLRLAEVKKETALKQVLAEARKIKGD